MTGGTIVILGKVGENFAAGMTGGMAFVYDPNNFFSNYVNYESVFCCKLEKSYWENVLKELNTKENIVTLKEMAPALSVNNISDKNLSYNNQMVDNVRELLFGSGPELNKVYGPYFATDSTVFYIKVSGWVTRVNISDQQKIDTWESVKNEMTETQALKKYSSYISNLMRGKKIKYDERNFEIFAEKVSKVYQIERSKKEKMIQSSIWESNNAVQIETLNAVKNMKDKIILHHDGKNWTINDIMSLQTAQKLIDNFLERKILILIISQMN